MIIKNTINLILIRDIAVYSDIGLSKEMFEYILKLLISLHSTYNSVYT